MRYTFLIPLVFLLGCATPKKEAAITPDNQRWLSAAKHMVLDVKDPAVSTPDPYRARIFVDWAEKNGYKVQVTHSDPVKGYDRNMIFIVVSK